MNPATDVGKKDLPDGLRSRFTEYFIDEPRSEHELSLIVKSYLGSLLVGGGEGGGGESGRLTQIVKFYTAVKRLADGRLTDGAGKKPTYSLRTLCRALIIRQVRGEKPFLLPFLLPFVLPFHGKMFVFTVRRTSAAAQPGPSWKLSYSAS